MIYLGENQITGIKLGNSDISAIYVGENIAYPVVEKCSNCVVMTATAPQTVTPPTGKTFEYSYDSYYWSAVTGSISFGDTNNRKSVYIRGKNADGINSTFVFGNNTSLITLSGNCMSLLDWENPSLDVVPASGFSSLFSNAAAIETVSDDFLPATTISDYSYASLFNLCTSLVNMPNLPATTIEDGSYASMFNTCTSLVKVKPILATTIGLDACSYMFAGCTSLLKGPSLSAMTMQKYCYEGMFSACTSLISPPALPATTLANFCYMNMFHSCTSLVNAPSLPATALSYGCYYAMFSVCEALKNAPILPAPSLSTMSYFFMFSDCKSLKEIHCEATDISTNYSLTNWLSGSAIEGNFYGKTAANWSDGDSGIPNGWNKHLI